MVLKIAAATCFLKCEIRWVRFCEKKKRGCAFVVVSEKKLLLALGGGRKIPRLEKRALLWRLPGISSQKQRGEEEFIASHSPRCFSSP